MISRRALAKPARLNAHAGDATAQEARQPRRCSGTSAILFPAAMPEPVVTVPPKRGASARTVSLIVASAMFMEQLDGTVLATALPTMAQNFSAEPLHMNVALTSYLLSLAVFIPASGRMADRFGSRTVFRAAIALFTLGSIACAQAPSLAFLVARAHAARHWRRDDVPGRPAGAAARGVKARLVSAMAWLMIPATDRPDPRPAGRRLHRHLSVLALDLLHQRADRPRSASCWSRCFIEEMREPTPARRSTCVGWCWPAPRWHVLMFGIEMASRGVGSLAVTPAAGRRRRASPPRSTGCTRATIRIRCWISA